MKVVTILAVTLFSLSSAEFRWGRCPGTNPVADFDLSKYLGNWYELIRAKDTPFESGKCARAHYEMLDDTYVAVTNTGIDNSGNEAGAKGWAYCNADGSGQCYVKFSRFQPWGDYEVLATDYTNYSVVFSCSSFFFFHFELGWVLARDIDVDTTAQIALLTESTKLKEEDLMFTNQSGCPDDLR